MSGCLLAAIFITDLLEGLHLERMELGGVVAQQAGGVVDQAEARVVVEDLVLLQVAARAEALAERVEGRLRLGARRRQRRKRTADTRARWSREL